MGMVVDVAGRGQCRDVTAVHGALIGKAQFRPSALVWCAVASRSTHSEAVANSTRCPA
jgi:hypothetical protein